jgi:glycosyltransferase involved in cell wall biosynthesis
MPFLEVITRTFNARPHLLRINQDSFKRQTNPDWVQTILVDDAARGIGYAGAMLTNYAPDVVGDYVWVLDDDDTCILPTLVVELKFIVADSDPDVIMVRMDHGAGRILPDDADWMLRPVMGRIGGSAVIVRRAVWQANAWAWNSGRYTHDFDFINALWDTNPTVYWHDVVASRVMRQSFGRPEAVNPWQRATPARA